MSKTSTARSAQHARMVALIEQLAPQEGYSQSLLEGVTLMRSNRAMASTQALYEPSIVIVIQGRKRGFHGGNLYVYDAQHYLVLSVPLPFSIETEASVDEPMLGLALRIDQALTSELAMALDANQPPAQPVSMYSTHMDNKLADATLRLLEALSSSTEARLLGPSIFREITYRVLASEQGSGLRAALRQNGNFARISNVLRRIHDQYSGDLSVTTLARQANLSVPAFHVQFKAVTATSPVQYIKAIRLHQARLLMIRNGLGVATAAERVGYQSPSQFSREFKRLFGRSPREESQHLKNLLSLAGPILPAA